jgi:hypothetical protein
VGVRGTRTNDNLLKCSVCTCTDMNIEIDNIKFSLFNLKWKLNNLRALVRGGTRFISFLLRKTKFTLATVTKQSIAVIKILAAVRLEFRSCRLNMGRNYGTYLGCVVCHRITF